MFHQVLSSIISKLVIFSTSANYFITFQAVQQVIAAKWAIEVINNQSLPHELNIGTSFYLSIQLSIYLSVYLSIS